MNDDAPPPDDDRPTPPSGRDPERRPETREGLLCRLGLHRPLPSQLWNDGHYFTSCARCRRPMIRKPEGKWHPVPPGLRVVWRARTADDIVWPTSIL